MADSIHPFSLESAKNFITKNPLLMGLGAMLLLSLVLPPRPRKRKIKKVRKQFKRNKNKQPKHLNGLKKRKHKTIPRAVGRISGDTRIDMAYGTPKERKKIKSYKTKKTRSSGTMPGYMRKGSQAAKDHMARLRAMRGKH
jgi:hypothetical protein